MAEGQAPQNAARSVDGLIRQISLPPLLRRVDITRFQFAQEKNDFDIEAEIRAQDVEGRVGFRHLSLVHFTPDALFDGARRKEKSRGHNGKE